jgi:hypothetical protein
MKKTNRRKNNIQSDIYVLNYTTSPEKCNNCKKRKPLLSYEVRNKVWNKSQFKLVMCKGCLLELQFELSQVEVSDDRKKHVEDMLFIISEMLKENKNVHQDS